MILWLVCWSLGQEVWLETWPGECVVFLDKTLHSYSAAFYPRSVNGFWRIVG